MRIGAIGGYGVMSSLSADYRINSIYGNPKSMEPVTKVGEDDYSGNPFAVVSKKQDEDALKIKEQQEKAFDYEGAMERAKQGLATAPSAIDFNYSDAIGSMMQGVRFSADTIPVVDLSFA